MKITISPGSAEIPKEVLNQLPVLFKLYNVPALEEIPIFARPWRGDQILEIVTMFSDEQNKVHHEFSFDERNEICFITVNFS